jgi:hypothetical protein
MKRLLKNYSLQNSSKVRFQSKNKRFISTFLFFILLLNTKSQVVNYVNNGSFEECINCTVQPYTAYPKYWGAIDSGYAFMYCSVAPPVSNLPYFANGYQYPRSGHKIIEGTIYCNSNTCSYQNSRIYPRNRLKQKLKVNTTYCVKYHVVNHNQNTIAIDAFGAYFGDESLDTIKYCRLPLTYLTPQIQNTTGNIINDTLGWTAITGTFIANGNEKYMVIGNFRSNAFTNTIIANPALLPVLATDIFFDDVSCIELNLPAFAGRDTSIFAGNSVFLGRQPDVGIDEVCQWYKLPVVITPTTPAIDTVAGFWVNPITTSTYVVRQEICGLVKWDTVVVYMDAVGIEKFNLLKNDLRLFPNPAQDILQMQFTVDVENEFKTIIIYNKLGQLLREEDLIFKNKTASIKTDDLENGVYVLKLHGTNLQTVSKRFVINH